MSQPKPSEPWPTEIRVHKGGGALNVWFDDGSGFELPATLLRAMTPSAEARGHGPSPFVPVKVAGEVAVTDVRPVGRYAVRLVFSDGHDTGLYTWDRLHRIGVERTALEAQL
jgi:DUF971 family protein